MIALWEALENLFARKVDLISSFPIKNSYLKASIDKTKQLIYDRKSEKILTKRFDNQQNFALFDLTNLSKWMASQVFEWVKNACINYIDLNIQRIIKYSFMWIISSKTKLALIKQG